MNWSDKSDRSDRSDGSDWASCAALVAAMLFLGGCRPAVKGEAPNPALQAMNRGVSLMGQYEYAKAVEAFQEALERQPELVEAEVNLAIALFNRGQKEEGDLDRAGQLLDQVLARQPNHARALYFRGVIFQHAGQAEASMPYLEKVVQQRPEDGAAWYLLGLSRQRLEQPAEEALLKAIELKPYLSSAYYKLWQIAMLEGATNRADRYLATFKRLRESPLNEIIELPQYGAMGDLALVQPLSVPQTRPTSPGRYRLGGVRVLYETQEALFRPPGPGLPLGGVAVGDLNRDSVPDLVLATSSEVAGGKLIGLLSSSPSQFREATAELGLAAVRNARSCAIGDFDNDEVNDLFLSRTGPNHLFRGTSNGTFVDVSAATGTAGGAAVSPAALFLDADHDGDLDVFVCNPGTGNAGNQLLNNNTDGTFTDLAATNGLACADGHTVLALPGDLDGDRDLDLVLLQKGRPARVFLNDLLGSYTALSLDGVEIRGDLGGVLQDFNGDGALDLVVLGGEPVALALFVGDGHGRFRPGAAFTESGGAPVSSGSMAAVRAADLDLDGDLDLAMFGREARFFLNDGVGRFAPEPKAWKPADGWTLAGVELVDLGGDQVPDLLCLEQGPTTRVTVYAGELSPPGKALAIRPSGMRGRDKRTRSPASGFGVSIRVRAGSHEQGLVYTGLNGGPSQSAVPAVFGLGGRAQADYAHLLWPDGVAQVEMALVAGRVHEISELQRKISSCPVLFAWNGERFAFVTDFAGVGGLGYFVAPGVCAAPQVVEHVKIEPEQLRPRDGQYELRVTEPMEETAYLDRLALWAVDHPSGASVYPDERLAILGPLPTHDWLVIEERLFPSHATSPSGQDCRERLLDVDRQYAYEPPLDRRFIGFCHPHTLELDFGEPLAGIGLGDRVFLFIHSFIEYPYSQTVYAAAQAGREWEPIRVDCLDRGGEWRTIVPDAGAPGGMARMMTVDLTGKLPEGATRLRLTTNLEIGYDQIFIGHPAPVADVQKHPIGLTDATLRPVGFPRESSPDGRWPLIYDYERRDPTAPFHVLRGAYTRFGAVDELLAEFDDRYVIMGPGDEIALRFGATALPPLRPGFRRSFILVSHAYCKDMDLYTAEPRTLEPLPFGGMSQYPYPAGERYPDTPKHREYQAQYNTRRVD